MEAGTRHPRSRYQHGCRRLQRAELPVKPPIRHAAVENGTSAAPVLDLDTKENAMRLWKPRPASALAAAAALALAVMLFDRHGVVNVLLMILIGAALVGMYLLRRYARAELLYLRHSDTDNRTARREPAPVRTGSPAGRGDLTGT
jgi:hypothetical protein